MPETDIEENIEPKQKPSPVCKQMHKTKHKIKKFSSNADTKQTKETIKTIIQIRVIISLCSYYEDGSTFTSKHCFKLQDPSMFISGKDGMPFIKWLAKTKRKITINNNFIDTPWLCMAYVISCVSGIACSHFEPYAQENRTRPKP